ncbi:MAG: hypothetical protein R6U29_10540 [Desulfosudaceae bacterium]
MNDFLKNLRNNQGHHQKQYDNKYKGQQRHDNRNKSGPPPKKNDIPDYLKALFDDLAPVLKNCLNQFAESQARTAAASERQAEALEKLATGMPETMRHNLSHKKAPRRRKIDQRKQEILEMIKGLRDENMTYEEVAAYLDEHQVPTFSGRGRWHAQTIHRLYMYYP